MVLGILCIDDKKFPMSVLAVNCKQKLTLLCMHSASKTTWVVKKNPWQSVVCNYKQKLTHLCNGARKTTCGKKFFHVSVLSVMCQRKLNNNMETDERARNAKLSDPHT